WVIEEVGPPHETALGADREQYLGRARHQRDDADRRPREIEPPPGLVGDGECGRRLRQQQGQGQCREQMAHHDAPGGSPRSLTPADLKVAISLKTAQAGRARPMASAVPGASPSRIERSRYSSTATAAQM